jgi:hypothetical protein
MSTNAQQVRLDAEGLPIFNRALEVVKARTYDIRYPNLKAMQIIPVSSEINPGATAAVYHIFNEVGLAEIIADYADDLPRVDVLGDEVIAPIRGIGVSYGYSYQEARAAAFSGMPLQQRRANTARRAVEQLIDRLAWTGDDNYGLVGLLNHPNIPRTTVENDGTGTATEWATKTSEQILRDMIDLVDSVSIISKGVHTANRLLLPLSQYTRVSAKRNSDASDLTVLEYFRRNRPNVVVDWLATELDGAGVDDADADVMIAGEFSADNLEMEIPLPFTQHDFEQRNLELVVPCEARFGGVQVFYPLAFAIGEGIGPNPA